MALHPGKLLKHSAGTWSVSIRARALSPGKVNHRRRFLAGKLKEEHSMASPGKENSGL